MPIRRNRPEINAGSMADIAFLLLIFFLVTTTMDADKGIQRKLPKWNPDSTPSNSQIQDRNILTILVNSKDKLLVEGEYQDVKDVKQLTLNFLDNNGNGQCSYCEGRKLDTSSDDPQKAVVSIQNDKNTSYKIYVAVQNEVTAAYMHLREREAKRIHGQSFLDLNSSQKKSIADLFPMKISEADAVKL